MASGIFSASITPFTNGTTADGPSVSNNDLSLKNNGVNNDSGLITTDGAGGLTAVKVGLSTGSISRIAHNSGVPCVSGKTTVTHALGAVPDFVLITINAGGVPTSGLVVGYNPGTLSSTQVDIWANGAFNVDVLTIKF